MTGEITGPLASGNTYRISNRLLEVVSPSGAILARVPRDQIVGVESNGSTVMLSQRGGAPISLQPTDESGAATIVGALGGLRTPPIAMAIAKSYDKEQHYIDDIGDMARSGWGVVSTCVFQPRSGWARIMCSLGWLAVVYPPKPQIVVTYHKLP
jgi:hypothetical protein